MQHLRHPPPTWRLYKFILNTNSGDVFMFMEKVRTTATSRREYTRLRKWSMISLYWETDSSGLDWWWIEEMRPLRIMFAQIHFDHFCQSGNKSAVLIDKHFPEDVDLYASTHLHHQVAAMWHCYFTTARKHFDEETGSDWYCDWTNYHVVKIDIPGRMTCLL